jgi:hypothetical protein
MFSINIAGGIGEIGMAVDSDGDEVAGVVAREETFVELGETIIPTFAASRGLEEMRALDGERGCAGGLVLREARSTPCSVGNGAESSEGLLEGSRRSQ